MSWRLAAPLRRLGRAMIAFGLAVRSNRRRTAAYAKPGIRARGGA